MNIKKLIMTITSLIIIGCGSSSGDSAVTVANSEPTNKEVKLIFSENFDNQEDWHSGLLINDTGAYLTDLLYDKINPARRIDMYQRVITGHTLPKNWDSVRQGEQYFSPRNGYPNSHENIEILASNSDKAKGKKGKSAVFWKDSHKQNNWEWNTDGILHKSLKEGYNELYVEFWISFDPNTTVDSWKYNTKTDTSKIFRMMSIQEGGNEFHNMEGTVIGPRVIWDWKENDYGVRNNISLAGGPHGENTKFKPEDLINFPKTGSFISHIQGHGPNGETEYPIDRENGGLIKDNLDSKGLAYHKQVFGNKGQWSKVAFYVKMNSNPDAKDGVLIQWLNGRRLLTVKNIPWVMKSSTNKMVKWNAFSIGGNDFFHRYPIEDAREEWYSIDDIKVYNGIPDHAEEDINFNE